MDGNGERLQQGSLLTAHVVGEFETEVGGVDVVAGQIAVVGRRGAEGHVQAEVVTASFAVVAHTARNARLDGDPVTWNEIEMLGWNEF